MVTSVYFTQRSFLSITFFSYLCKRGIAKGLLSGRTRNLFHWGNWLLLSWQFPINFSFLIPNSIHFPEIKYLASHLGFLFVRTGLQITLHISHPVSRLSAIPDLHLLLHQWKSPASALVTLEAITFHNLLSKEKRRKQPQDGWGKIKSQ